jgi:hypothetical protein
MIWAGVIGGVLWMVGNNRMEGADRDGRRIEAADVAALLGGVLLFLGAMLALAISALSRL